MVEISLAMNIDIDVNIKVHESHLLIDTDSD